MASLTRRISLAAPLLLGACAAVPPTGPSVLALPAKGKDLAQFQEEDAACRQYAAAPIGDALAAGYSSAALQQRYDIGYIQCMTAKGNIAPVVTGAPGYRYYPYRAYPYYGYPYFPY